ncbi:MAG TPA: 1-acyl-sn-glycerol-3-phosphate acyltransferase [Clostridiaceae bacterium]|nr:1-acyl-sn-glycerol-3-phosphate acyltransferase [Clostridiaceae bacterium]
MKNSARFHKFVYRIVLPIVRLLSLIIFGFYRPPAPDFNGPLLIISNHVTHYDYLFVAISLRRHLYFVASEHAFRRKLLSRIMNLLFAPIPHSKANLGVSTVLNIKRKLAAGHNVCIFAEDGCSFNGQSIQTVSSTARVLRKLGASVVTLRIRGGYFTNPRWGKHLRRGRMIAEWVNVYSPDQLAQMSDDDLKKAINRDIFVDAYVDGPIKPIPYKGKNLAENIEFTLVMCPHCRRLNHLRSKGNEFFCSCGLRGRYTEFGNILGKGFPFKNIKDWDIWQRRAIADLPDMDHETVLCSDPDQFLMQINEDHSTKKVAVGELRLTPTRLSIGRRSYLLSDISRLALIKQGYLVFSTRDGELFEIRNHRQKYAGYLYVLLVERFSKHRDLTPRMYGKA